MSPRHGAIALALALTTLLLSLLGPAPAGAASLNAMSWDDDVLALPDSGGHSSVAVSDAGDVAMLARIQGFPNRVAVSRQPAGQAWDDTVELSSMQYPFVGNGIASGYTQIVGTGEHTFVAAWTQVTTSWTYIPVVSRFDGTSWDTGPELQDPFDDTTLTIDEETMSLTYDSSEDMLYLSGIDESVTNRWVVSTSADGGVTWSAPVFSSGAVQPYSQDTWPNATVSNGTLYLAAVDNSDNERGYVWTYDAASGFTAPVQINPQTATSGSFYISSISAHDDSVIVSWAEDSEYWLGTSVSHDGGATWVDDTLPDGISFASGQYLLESVEVTEFGYVHVYTTELSGNYDIRVRTSEDGLTWSAPTILEEGMSSYLTGGVTTAADDPGNILVAWGNADSGVVSSQMRQGAAGVWDDSVVVSTQGMNEMLSADGGPGTRFAIDFVLPGSAGHVVASSSASPSFVAAAPPAAATVGSAYAPYTFIAQAWPPPVYSIATGSLPPGLALDGTTGVLSGTPTTAGSYTFVVEAANTQAPSTQSAPVTITVTGGRSPASVATPPRAVVAQAGDASALVSWTAPADAGAYAITSYQVQASPGGRSCLVAAPRLSCTVTGLSEGTAYTMRARALNGRGWSRWSAPSAAVVPEAPAARPGPVRALEVVSATAAGEVTLRWQAPRTDGGAPVTRYRVYTRQAGTDGYVRVRPDATTPTATVTGLTPGASYWFIVRAGNEAGFGPRTRTEERVRIPR